MSAWRVLRLATRLAVGVLPLIALIVGLLHTAPARRFVLDKARSALERSGILFEASSLDYNLLILRFTLSDLHLRSADTTDLSELFHADMVSVDLRLRDLVRGRYTVESAVVQAPEIRIVTDGQGRTNIPPSLSGSGEEPAAWFVNVLRVVDASLTFEDRRRNVAVRFPAWQATMQGDAEGRLETITWSTDRPGEIRHAGGLIPIDTATAELILTIRDASIDVRAVRIASGDSELRMNGLIRDFADPILELAVSGDLALDLLGPTLIAEPGVSGELRIQADISGRASSSEIRAVIEGDRVVLGPLGESGVQAMGSYNVAENRLRVNTFTLRSPLISSTGDAEVAFDSDAGESRINAGISSVNLPGLSRFLNLPASVTGQASGSIRASWPGLEYNALTGNAQIRLRGVDASGGPFRVRNVGGLLDVVIRDGNIAVAANPLAADGIIVNGDFGLSAENTVYGRIQIDAADAAAMLKDSPVSGAISAVIQVDGTLAAPRIDAQLAAPGLSYQGIRGIQIEAAARYAQNAVDIGPAFVRWQGQTLETSGRIGLAGRSAVLDLSADLPDAAIGPMLTGIPGVEVPVSGQVNASATITGTVEKPLVRLQLRTNGIEAYQEPIGALSAEARFENGNLYLDDLVLDQREGALRANGRLDAASTSYELNMDGRGLTLWRFLFSESLPVQGTIGLTGRTYGTFENPEASLRLDIEGLRVKDNDIGDVRVDVAVANRSARIDAALPSFETELKASVGIDSPFPVEFTLQTNGVEVSGLQFLQSLDLSGRITAALSGDGRLSDPGAMRVSARVSPLDLKWMSERVTSDGPIEVSLAEESVTVQEFALRAAGSTVQLAGSFPVRETAKAGDLRIDIDAQLADLLRFQSRERDVTMDAVPQLEGALAVHASLRGYPNSIDASGDITIEGATISSSTLPVPFTNVDVKAVLDGGTLELDRLSGNWGSAIIEARGVLPLSLVVPSIPIVVRGPDRPAHLSGEIREFRLSTLPGVPEGVDGLVALRIDADASSADLKTLAVSVSFPELRLKLGNYEIQQTGTSSLQLRDGRVSVGQLELTGPETRLRITGSTGIQAPMTSDLLLEATANASIVSLFAREFPVSGNTTARLAVQGNLNEPHLDGFLDVSNGQIALAEPRVNVEGLRLRIDVSDNRFKLAELQGALNGGMMSGDGEAVLSAGGIASVQMRLHSKGSYLEFPEGVRTVSNADISVAGNSQALMLSGNVDVLEGSYTEPLAIERSLFRYFVRRPEPAGAVADTDLDTLRLNVGLHTLTPLTVDTEFARGSVTADLQLTGTAAKPGLTGRVVVDEGAELTLRERTYLVDRGVINFADDREIRPLVDVSARTKASIYDITMQLQTDENLGITTRLTADPPLPEIDIIALLTTGRTVAEAQAAGFEVAREQVLSYLAGTLGGGVTQQAGRSIGLSQLQIEPSLIASEAEPTARLTVGKKITPQLNFVYSMNLRNSSDQMWIGEYDISRQFSTRALRQIDNTYRFQFQHNLAFGGLGEDTRGSRAAIAAKRIGSIQFVGDTQFSDSELRRTANLETGRPYDFFATRRALDRLRDLYSSAEYLEARIYLTRTELGPMLDLRFDLQAGPRVEIVYEGWDVSTQTKQAITKQWASVPIDSLRLQDAIALIERELAGRGYLRAGVDAEILAESPASKRVLFRIHPGVYHDSVAVAFEGVTSMHPSELEDLLKRAGYLNRLHSSGLEAARFLQQHYAAAGFLDALVAAPEYELTTTSLVGRFVFPVAEGEQYEFGEIRFSGNRAFSEEALRKTRSMIEAGQVAVAESVERARAAVEGFYQDEGFNDAAVQYRFSPDVNRHVADVTFEVEENRRRVLDHIQVEGNDKTSEGLIRSQVGLSVGETVSGRKLAQARSNLYSVGAYSLVEIDALPRTDLTSAAADDVAVTVLVRVREIPPFELRYGGFYDTERGVGGIADFLSHNVMGGARTAGVRARYDADLWEFRTYFSQPTLRRLPLKSVGAIYFRRETATDFLTDRIGGSANAEFRIGEQIVAGAGYLLEWVHTYDKVPDPVIPFDVWRRKAALTGSFTRDTRDDTLDATRGGFTSHTLEWTPGRLGSELRYMKYFGQYFHYMPFGQPSRTAWEGGIRNRTVYALGGRVGLAHGLGGQSIVPSERFFSGGGTTIRGFEQNTLGPLDFTDEPAGGDAVLVLNNELRFPVYRFLDGVGFFDAGNVYRHIEDITLSGLRTSAGAGIRIRTPYALIRLDYGVNLSPRSWEPRGKLFFSIGQAF